MKDFVSSFVDFFTMSLYSVRLSVYTYWGNSASLRLSNSDDPVQVMKVTKMLRYSNQSSTSLYCMLYYVKAYQNKKNSSYQIKNHSPLVLFVGSKLYYESYTKSLVTILKKAGFNIYMVGIGENVDKKQLQNILGPTNTTNLIFVRNFYELNTIKTQLLKKTCSGKLFRWIMFKIFCTYLYTFLQFYSFKNLQDIVLFRLELLKWIMLSCENYTERTKWCF